MLVRPRLEGLLDEATLRLLTLVCAPAGFGTTSLLSQWSAHRSGRTAWLTLDESDSDLAQFVRALVAAVQTVESGVGHDTLSLVSMGAATAARQLAAAFSDDLLHLGDDLTIILDEYHVIDEPEVHAFVTAVLRLPPPRLHLVIASRADPPLPIARLRAHGSLAEVRSDDLRFTREETAEFLRRALEVEPAAELVNETQELSEGWITLIHLAALSARSHARAATTSSGIVSASRTAIEYLADDVVDRQPPPVQEFLGRIAVPEHVSADLAAVLAGAPWGHNSSQDALKAIEQAGLFLFPLGDDHLWYRFHPVFRRALLQRLEREIGRGGLRDLHRKASRWFGEQGDVEEAVKHALFAGDAAQAATLVSRDAQAALLADRWLDLDRWIDLLPAESRNADPGILLARCWLAYMRGQYGTMQALIDRVRDLIPAPHGARCSAALAIIEAELDVLRAMVTDSGDELDATVASSYRAMEVLRGTGRYAEAVSVLVHGMILGLRGRDAAMAFLNRIVAADSVPDDAFAHAHTLCARLARVLHARHERDVPAFANEAQLLLQGAMRARLPRFTAAGHLFLGMARYESNLLHEAEAHARASLGEPANGVSFRINAAMLLALCLNAQQHTIEADLVIDAMLDRLLESEATDLVPHLRTFRAHLALTRGDVAAAVSRLGPLDANETGGGIGGVELRALTRATAWVFDRNPLRLAAAAELLTITHRRAESLKLHNVLVQVLLLQAALHRTRGQDDAAAARVRQALAIGERAGYVRTIVDIGAGIRPLLEWHARHAGTTPYLERLLQLFQMVRTPDLIAAPPMMHRYTLATTIPLGEVEALTEREVDVLLGLQRRLSNKEIADELSISPLTIKTHTRNIYGKLGVNSRRQAIARALELGLLSRI